MYFMDEKESIKSFPQFGIFLGLAKPGGHDGQDTLYGDGGRA